MPRNIDPPPHRPAYFWWLLANALALSFAVLSWTACLHVFGNPEIPRNYALLKKIGRLPALENHASKDLPTGDGHDAKVLYRRFITLGEEQLLRFNSRTRRDYITNFKEPLALIYIDGDYRIEETRKLRDGDYIKEGFVLRARAVVKPDEFTKAADYPVMIEYIFPTSDVEAGGTFKKGDIFSITKIPNGAVVLNATLVQLDDEPVVWLTAVPISHGLFRNGENVAFEVKTPTMVNPTAKFPLFSP